MKFASSYEPNQYEADIYAISDEEWENAKSDMNAGLMLFKRMKNGYEAQKACYKDVADYDTSKIEANIKEAQSKIE